MNKDDIISEEQLNAFVDGELESEERNSLFTEAERSEELDRRLCQQRKLKELVKHAYRDTPEPKRRLTGRRTPGNIFGLTLAASLLLTLGVTTGMLVDDRFNPGSREAAFAVGNSSPTVVAAENYILHVTSGKPEQMKLALQQARALLSASEPDNPHRVEIVANERGLDLLRSDKTLFSQEIRELAHDKVVFYACSKAIQRLEEKGIVVQLVPEATPGFTALDRVVTRMNDGWQYVKI